MNIVTYENTVRIDDTTIPKNGFIVRKLANAVRLDYLSTAETIDIKLANTFIDGVPATSLEQIFQYFIEQGFTNGGVTSEWVTEQIINAQLEGEEIDLSIYAKKTDLNPLNSNISNLQSNKLNISDWTPYKNKVDALNTQTELNLQFAQIADSIRELDEEKVNRNELSNEYVSYDVFDNQNLLNSNNFALKTQLNDYALKSDIPDALNLRIYTTVVSSSDGVWSVTFPTGKFTQPPLVFATAIGNSGSSSNRANFASVDQGVTTTSATGIAKRATSAGLLAAMEMINADCQVQILAVQL